MVNSEMIISEKAEKVLRDPVINFWMNEILVIKHA